MFALRHVAAVLVTLFLLPSVLGAVLAPRTSGAPQCQYKCPAYDDKGNELEKEAITGPNIKCTYGHNPVRNCFYDRQNGYPKSGNSSKCPDKAVKKCNGTRRANRAMVEAYEVQRKRRAAMPAPTVPEYMNTRSALKKRVHEDD